MNGIKTAGQSGAQEIPGIVWDETAQQWLATHECDGHPVFRRYYPLINDAIAALKSVRSGKSQTGIF